MVTGQSGTKGRCALHSEQKKRRSVAIVRETIVGATAVGQRYATPFPQVQETGFLGLPVLPFARWNGFLLHRLGRCDIGGLFFVVEEIVVVPSRPLTFP